MDDRVLFWGKVKVMPLVLVLPLVGNAYLLVLVLLFLDFLTPFFYVHLIYLVVLNCC